MRHQAPDPEEPAPLNSTDQEGGEVIPFPARNQREPARTEAVEAPAPAAPDHDEEDEEVLVGEIVDDTAAAGAPGGGVEVYDAGPSPAQIAHAYWRRARPQLRPDRVALAVARHELVFGPRGLAHGAGPLWRWVTAAELDTHLATNPKMVLETRKKRRILLLSGVGGAAAGTAAAWILLSPLAVVAAGLMVLAVAGAFERNRSTAALEGGDRNREGIGTDPSARDLKQALSQVKGLGRADDMRVIGPVVRDEADTAWTAIVQGPVSFTKVRAKHGDIATVFDVATSQLRLTPVASSEARVRIWCADTDPLSGPPVMSPLIGRTTPFDIWTEQIPMGITAQGKTAEFSPFNKAGMLTAGESGSGKSVADDQMLCAGALDPYAQLWLVDAKRVELTSYRPIAHEYLDTPDREEFKALLVKLTAEKDRRLAAMAKAGVNLITGDNWRRFNAPFIFFHVDEVQIYTVGEKNKEVTELIGKLVSQCRATGIFASIATQYPKNEVVDTFFRVNLTVRLALRCEGTTASNVALGDGMAGRGFSAAEFTQGQKGAAWLKGSDKGDPVQLRTGYLEKPDDGKPGTHHVRDIVEVATRLRAEAGTLPTGDDRPAARLLRAMVAIVESSGQRNLHTTEHLLPALAAHLPETAGWGPEDLAAALPEGVRSGTSRNVRAHSDTEGREMSRPGYRLSDLQAALERL